MTRTGTALAATVKQFGRTPVLLALLVVLPAYFVGLIGYVLPTAPITVVVAGTAIETTLAAAVLPMLAALAAVMVTGIAGLFLTVDTLDADGWLALSGLPGRVLFAARAVSLLGVGAVASVAATALLAVHVTPERPVVFLAGTVVLAVSYGLLGAIVGVLTGRLAGVYVMLFGPAVDLFLVHSPLATDPPAWGVMLPGAYAGTAAMDAAFTATTAWTSIGAGLAYLGVVAALATVVVARATHT